MGQMKGRKDGPEAHLRAVVMPALALAVLITPAEPARAQAGQEPREHSGAITAGDAANRYERQYGEPEFWTLSLLVGPEARLADLPRGAIRTVGRLLAVELPRQRLQVQLCTEDDRGCLDLDKPVPEIADAFFAQAIFRHEDMAEVVGAFGVVGDGFGFWSFSSGPPRAERDRTRAITIEDLVISPTAYVGRTVAVQGCFQGRNLFEDMPEGSALDRDDWVLKDGGCFIWITGHPPRGEGFSLDLDDRGATTYRLEVAGVPDVRDGLVYLEASAVRLLGRTANDPEG
jgi:hypothetical protein